MRTPFGSEGADRCITIGGLGIVLSVVVEGPLPLTETGESYESMANSTRDDGRKINILKTCFARNRLEIAGGRDLTEAQ